MQNRLRAIAMLALSATLVGCEEEPYEKWEYQARCDNEGRETFGRQIEIEKQLHSLGYQQIVFRNCCAGCHLLVYATKNPLAFDLHGVWPLEGNVPCGEIREGKMFSGMIKTKYGVISYKDGEIVDVEEAEGEDRR